MNITRSFVHCGTAVALHFNTYFISYSLTVGLQTTDHGSSRFKEGVCGRVAPSLLFVQEIMKATPSICIYLQHFTGEKFFIHKYILCYS